jgi:hypothetical protein
MNDNTPPRSAKMKAAQVRALVVGGIIGAIITGGFLLVIGVLLMRQTLPPLTQESLDAAYQRWQEQQPEAYDYDVQVTGNRPSSLQVQVRRGQVTHLVRDGNANTPLRTWSFWSIDGLFDALERELEMAGGDRAKADNGTQQPTHGAVLHAQFNSEWGYPEMFRRHVPGQQLDMGWRITRFEVVTRGGSQTADKFPTRQD